MSLATRGWLYWLSNRLDPIRPVASSKWHPAQFSVAGHWAGLAGYAIQVFCDFAGYSLLAIGSARLFGITLPDNFRLPYLSTSMLEFWRRWHITLTNWLFDYIYTPLTTGTGFWRGKYTLALLLVFLVSGLWHGAALTFVVWGAVHGVALMVNREWDEYYRTIAEPNTRPDRTFGAYAVAERRARRRTG